MRYVGFWIAASGCEKANYFRRALVSRTGTFTVCITFCDLLFARFNKLVMRRWSTKIRSCCQEIGYLPNDIYYCHDSIGRCWFSRSRSDGRLPFPCGATYFIVYYIKALRPCPLLSCRSYFSSYVWIGLDAISTDLPAELHRVFGCTRYS